MTMNPTNPFLNFSIDELTIAWNNYTCPHGGDPVDMDTKKLIEEAVMENIGVLVSFSPSFRYGIKKKRVTLNMYPRK